MRKRSQATNDAGRIPKKIEFEPPIYRKAEKLIKADKKRPTLKTKLSELIEDAYDRMFIPAKPKP